MQRIDDPDDPALADYRHLTDAAARRAAHLDGDGGCIVVEGVLALQRVLAAGSPLRSVLVTPERARTLGALLEAVPADVPVLVAERPVLRDVTGFDVHRGVLASARRPPTPSADDVLDASRRVVVCEALNDHENLGSLFRNAAATGVDAVLLDDRSADPWYRRSVRVSLGWAAVLPHARLGPLADGYPTLRRHGFRVVALTPVAGALDVDRAAADGLLDDPLALVVGAEGPGLSEASIGSADVRVRVPMAEGVDSLNVATALAVVASFAAARRGWT